MQDLSSDERQRVVGQLTARRAGLQRRIEATANERSAYLGDRFAAEGGAEDSLDRELFDAARKQKRAGGLRCDADAPAD